MGHFAEKFWRKEQMPIFSLKIKWISDTSMKLT